LLGFTSSPIVKLNRAIALAETGAVAAALSVIERLDLGDYYLFHATRGNFMERLGRLDQAAEAYALAATLTSNIAEKDHLHRSAQRARASTK
ncbi:MAG TPA: hypothetical protein VMP13_05025, partial [Acidimicrobiia bacterium]|nr:hypothetical protein [Acidimicrobiia bacterium]